MRTYYDMCRHTVAERDRDRYLATLYAPAAHRDALFALFAFGVEIERVRELAREPLPGEIRLQWWREVLHGERGEQALANPVSAALIDTIKRYDLPVTPFERLIEAHTFDIYDEPMLSIRALETYADETQAALLTLAAQVLGAQVLGAQVLGAQVLGAQVLGARADAALLRATASAQVFRDVLVLFAQHAARRQIYVPLEILHHFGAKREDILAGQASVELRAALAEMRLRARRHLAAAEELRLSAPPAILPLLLPAASVRPALQRMERRGYDPFAAQGVAPMIPAWRRQWRIWRAARNPRKIFS